MDLKNSIKELSGVGPKKYQALQKFNIETIEDLLYLLPRKYEDRRCVSAINDAKVDENNYIAGEITKVVNYRGKGNKRPLALQVYDGTGSIEVVYFNSLYLRNKFYSGVKYAFYGKVTVKNNRLQMIQPEFTPYDEAVFGIFPLYPLTAGLTQRDLRKFQKTCQSACDSIKEWLPKEVLNENKLCDLGSALKNIHFPSSEKAYRQSKFRLVFDELFIFQMGLSLIKNMKFSNENGIQLNEDDAENEFIDSLKFELTSGQTGVWQSIKQDLESNKEMNRLVQGDVGSGKTVISEIAIYKTIKNGYQAVMMAPTEILARQHYETIKNDFEKFGINVELLCGSMKTNEKKFVLEKLKNGDVDLLIGTHALIENGVEFFNLGLVVTDEQHRFGVRQRDLLVNKGNGVNVLVMTATPIPRTLAVVLYGDLDISIIDTMPEGRLKVITESFSSRKRKSVYMKVDEEIESGHQCYVVAPLIEDSENIEANSVDEVYSYLTELLHHRNIQYLHGSMKQSEKDEIMERFNDGLIDILVSTVVIEVGINVPNATVMVIENSERFGLAQLHQLRGRVGRGDAQSYCYLISKNATEVSKARIEIMTSTNDGMEIAEEDLRLRGPGDFFGTKQHGLPEMKNANLVDHIDILNRIRPQVERILQSDPTLHNQENKNIKDKVIKLFEGNLTLKL